MTIASLIASTSDDAGAKRHRAPTLVETQNNKRVNAGMSAGYSNKFFKNTLITFMERRRIDISAILNSGNTTGIGALKVDTNGNAPKYKLCIPCEQIYLTYEDEEDPLPPVASNVEGEFCYTIPARDGAYYLSPIAGAGKTCADIEGKNITIQTKLGNIIDSASFKIVENDFAVDYSNIEMAQDTEQQELSQVFLDAKADAISKCVNDDFKKSYDTVLGLFIGSTATSAASTGTAMAGTAVGALSIGKNDTGKSAVANTVLSGVSSAGGIATSVMGFVATGEIDKLIERVNECKKAATKMYNAGVALETQLKELTEGE